MTAASGAGAELAGERALVTGAARGIGRAVAAALAAGGAHVLALDRDGDRLDDAVAQMRAAGGSAEAVVCDLAAPAAAAEQVGALARAGGAIGILVNNAAVYPRGALLDWSLDEVATVQRVNVESAFALAQAVVPGMRERGRGRIVNLSSITIRGGWTDLAPYVTSKAALVGMTRALAGELGPDGITVNAVAPGAIPTDAEPASPDGDAAVLARQAVKRRGTPADVAAAVAFLVGERSSFVTGQLLAIDGGFGWQGAAA